VRRLLSGAAAAGCAGYGAWSWLRGPRPWLPLVAAPIHRILVIRVDLLGDLVFSVPTFAALRAAFPSAQIDVLVLPYTAQILSDLPAVDRVHTLDVNRYRRPFGRAELQHLVDTIRSLRAQRYDLAVSLSGIVGGPLAIASGARIRLGYAGDSYSGCFNVPGRGRRYDRPVHEVDYELDLLRSAGIPAPRAVPTLPYEPGDRDTGGTGAATRQPTLPTSPYVVIVPGASNGSAKRWPERHWAAVGDWLTQERGFTIVLAGAASERELASHVAEMMTMPALNLAGATSIAELRGLLAGAALLLAGDTGPLHLAAALGRPVVGVYGPTDPTNTGPLGTASAAVRLGLPCSPCYDLRSPADCKLPDRSAACMANLEPARVIATVDAVLADHRGNRNLAADLTATTDGAELRAGREARVASGG
jgi:lipopolysaccharide heptosyltransferase II